MGRRDKGEERVLAMGRIRRLLQVASEAQRRRESVDEVKRYVRLARRIGMRYQISLPAELRRRVCRRCDTLLTSGVTARHRTTGGRLSVTCLACGTVRRYPFKPLRKVVA